MILEDEFTRGYRGRLRVLNQYPTANKFMQDLRKVLHSQDSSLAEPSATELLALVADVPIKQFVRHHSLLPFHRLVSLKDHDVAHGDPSRLDLVKHFGTRGWRQSIAMFCPQCVNQDIEEHKFSYWRRTHQLPGIPWCMKHGIQLLNASVGKQAFDNVPLEAMPAKGDFSDHEFSEIFQNPVIRRYAEIAIASLAAEKPMPVIHARFRIAERAKKLQLRIGVRGRLPTLTDMLLEHVPEYWLRKSYPEIEGRLTGEFFNSIDNITLGLATDQSYALALALLFDSSDEALDYWYGDIEGLPAERKTQRKFGKDYWSSEKMLKLYVEHRGNHTSMGQALGIDPTYARIELNAAGLPALGLVGVSSAARAVMDFQAGMSLEAACESNGASRDEVEKLIRVGISKLSTAINEISQSIPRKGKPPSNE